MNAPLNHPLPLLDLDVLRTFVAIAETGSFTTAANAVFRTPSAVSMQIKKLEDILGRCVFSRDARSVSLTTDGEMLLGYARRMLAINREAVSKFIIPDIVGVVRLGSPDDYGERVLPHVLKRFAQSHPSIAVDVVIDQSGNLRRRMDDRTLDITLVTNSSKISMADAEVLLTEPIVWAGAKGGCAHLREPLPVSIVGRGLRLAGRRARCAGQAGPQLPRRLYERAHRRPALGDPGRPGGRADAEILPRRRSWSSSAPRTGCRRWAPTAWPCWLRMTLPRRSRLRPTISVRRSNCSARPDGSRFSTRTTRSATSATSRLIRAATRFLRRANRMPRAAARMFRGLTRPGSRLDCRSRFP